jgi:hypothetical protein
MRVSNSFSWWRKTRLAMSVAGVAVAMSVAAGAPSQVSPITPIPPVAPGTPGVYPAPSAGQVCDLLAARCPGLGDATSTCITNGSACTYCASPLYQTQCVVVPDKNYTCANERSGHPFTGDCGAVMVGICNQTSCTNATPTGMNCARLWCRSGP